MYHRAARMLFAVAAFAALSAVALADPIQMYFAYCGEPNGLGCGCAVQGRVPFADGTNSWCVFWDRNGNGPDSADELLEEGDDYGQANYSCGPFNGSTVCGIEGNFAADASVVIGIPPEAPDQPLYYLKVSGPTCCWISDTVRGDIGYNEFFLTEAQWSCEEVSCPFGDPPAPVTAVDVSQDLYCLRVDFTWEHDGEDITGFNIYKRTSDAGEWEFVYQEVPAARSSSMDVCADGVVQIGVQAVNGAQTANIVGGAGSTFLRRFDPTGEITYLGGTDYRLNLVRPLSGACGAFLWFDLYSGGNFVQRLRAMTNPDSALIMSFNVTLPGIVPNPQCAIVMLDSSITLIGCGLSDTTSFTVDADDSPVLAREFSLSQNYPNPFNPATMIEYSLATDGAAELSIFNLRGQLVATLFSGNATAGTHRAEWHAADLPSGMYFYRLQAGNQVLTRKMLLMK